jgi:amidase
VTRPSELTATEARRLIGTKKLSPTELLESCIEQIEAIDPAVNAMVVRAYERARNEAKAAEAAIMRGDSLGALHGLPVAIKDIQATEGIRTTNGTRYFEHNVPTADDDIVATIRSAGGIVVGKTNIPEMSIGANTVNRLFGATGNPFDVSRTCGGSSGGAAVAVACNMVPLATGSDHGGSLRIPASFCGVLGYRPTPGVVPAEKRTITQTFYSVQGPVARTVEDAALLLSVIAQRRNRLDPMAFPLDAAALARLEPTDVSKLRIAVSADLGGVLLSEATRRTFKERVARFSAYPAKVEWHEIDLRDAPMVDWHLRSDIFVAQYHRDIANYDTGFNPNIRRSYDAALEMSMDAIARARRRQMELYQRFQAVFDDFDLLICPATSVSPFPWRDLYPREVDGKPIENYMAWLGLTASITVVGHPVVALPCGTDELQLPFGIQVIGPSYGDRTLLSAARALEQLFSTDPELARPLPDFSKLRNKPSDCRTEGVRVH